MMKVMHAASAVKTAIEPIMLMSYKMTKARHAAVTTPPSAGKCQYFIVKFYNIAIEY